MKPSANSADLLTAALSEAGALAEGWDGVMLSIERSEKFTAFGCGWSVLIHLILGSDDGLPNARVLLFQKSVPAGPADVRAARDFAAADALRQQVEEKGFAVKDTGHGVVIERYL